MVNFESQVKQDFPNFYIPLPEVRFPFKEVNMHQAYDLITTQYPLQSHTGAHPRRFPHQFLLLVLFCKCDFKMQSFLILAEIRRLYHLSQTPSRKTSYTTHSFRHKVGLILSRTKSISKIKFLCVQALHKNRSPRTLGRLPYAITIAQSSIFQHPPQTGRKQQAPKASQICSLTDFQPRLRNKCIDQNNVPSITLKIVTYIRYFVKFSVTLIYASFIYLLPS